MFQDDTGNPVTADGQAVAMILDKKNTRESLSTSGWSQNSGDGTVVVTGNSFTITGATTTTRVDLSPVGWDIGDFADITITTSGTNTNPIIYLGGGYPYVLPSGTTTFKNLIIANTVLRVQIDTGAISVNVTARGRVVGNHATQATAASRPLYKTSGGKHWLEFDGVDDSLSVGTMSLTGTDEVTLFAGLSKVDIGTRIIVELSTSWFSNAGTFILYQFNTAFVCASTGSVGGSGSQESTYTTSLADHVLTSSHDISGDLTSVRVDTVAGTNATGDKGAGNFGSHALYVGARAGTSLFYNGRIYQLVILGKTASGTEITDTETFINNKTGAY